MKVTFSDARLWRYIMSAVGKFIELGSLYVSESGLSFKAMDPSRTSLTEFIIPREAFDEFVIEGAHKLTLNIEDIGKILRTAEKDDKISIEWTESTITFIFERRGVPRSFTLPLQTAVEAEEIPELSLDLKNAYKVSGTVLYESIKGIEDVGDVLRIEGDEQHLSLRSISDIGEAEVILDVERGTLEEAEVNNPGFSVAYSIEYFSYMKQPIKLADYAYLRADSDMPCHLELNYMQGAKFNYYVAPRVE